MSQILGKLAEVSQDPRPAVQAPMKVAKDESSSKALTTKIKERVLKSYYAFRNLVFPVARITPPHGNFLPVHMVDSEKKICDKEVDLIINGSAELLDGNDSYPVISIVGAQSSGKSYLLNQLFGTKFPVMDGKRGWKQTTRGIMMAKCTGPSVLLLDVEGFDGTENEEDIAFQNQSALFALIVSDLMIVNMNICNISLEGGAGTQIFRTIFQERERMQRAGLTEVLVVLRNYCNETPLDILKTQVMNKLQKIWESANKKSMNFEDYIKVDIFGMPDKNSAEFPAEVIALRRLLSKSRSTKVPASTFTAISKEIWEKVQDNDNLVIPSHQELIANVYCGRLVEKTLKTLDSEEDYMLLKAEQSPSCFRTRSDALLETVLTGYDLETEVYEPDVKDKGRKILIDELNKNFAGYAKKIILTIMESTVVQFKGEFDRIIKIKPVDAKSSAEQIVQAYIVKFKSSCEDLKEFDSVYLEGIYGQLKDQMQSYTSLGLLEIAERKEHERKKGLNNIERKEHERKKGLNNIWQAHQKNAKEKKLVQNAVIIGVFASLALGGIGIAIAAACTGQFYAIAPAVSVAVASAGQVTASAIQLANRDCDKSD